MEDVWRANDELLLHFIEHYTVEQALVVVPKLVASLSLKEL